MIKLRILRCVKIKCFFFLCWKGKKTRQRRKKKEKDKNNRVTYWSKKCFLSIRRRLRQRPGVWNRERARRKKKEEGFSLLLGTGSIKASGETDKLSALQQNAISSQSFSLSLSLSFWKATTVENTITFTVLYSTLTHGICLTTKTANAINYDWKN